MPIIRSQKTIEDLSREIDELQTAMKAMWEILKQKTGATEEELHECVDQLTQSITNKLRSDEPKAAHSESAPGMPKPAVVAKVEKVVTKVEKVAEEVEKPVAKEIEEPVVEITEEPVAEITEEPVAEITEEPVAEITEEPVAEIAEEPVVESIKVEEPIVEIVEKEESSDLGVEPIHVKIRGDLVKCPTCSKIFSVRDIRYWDGAKHTVCGTPLKVEGIEDLVF